MASAVESRDELLSRYVLGEAVETFVKILAGFDTITWTLDGTPFKQFIPEDRLDELDTVLRRMGDEDFSALWPLDEDDEDRELPGFRDAQRTADLLAAQMLLAVLGDPDFIARAARALLERSGAVPASCLSGDEASADVEDGS